MLLEKVKLFQNFRVRSIEYASTWSPSSCAVVTKIKASPTDTALVFGMLISSSKYINSIVGQAAKDWSKV